MGLLKNVPVLLKQPLCKPGHCSPFSFWSVAFLASILCLFSAETLKFENIASPPFNSYPYYFSKSQDRMKTDKFHRSGVRKQTFKQNTADSNVQTWESLYLKAREFLGVSFCSWIDRVTLTGRDLPSLAFLSTEWGQSLPAVVLKFSEGPICRSAV